MPDSIIQFDMMVGDDSKSETIYHLTYNSYTRKLEMRRDDQSRGEFYTLPTRASDAYGDTVLTISYMKRLCIQLAVPFTDQISREALAQRLDKTIVALGDQANHQYQTMTLPSVLSDLIEEKYVRKMDVKLQPKTYDITLTVASEAVPRMQSTLMQ